MIAVVGFWYLIAALPISAIFYKLKWIDAAYITAVSGVAMAIIGAIAAIVTTYFGAAAYDDVRTQDEEGS